MMNKPAIVTIAYNRPEALKRLLTSIEAAVYPEGVHPDLVISIDKSDSDEVKNAARKFEYSHGNKVIIEREERMGLRAHVLACGDIDNEYGSIIVLEDDLYVSPAFYSYAVAALDFTSGDERIGAVSLYNHLFNVHARVGFTAIDDGFDNWYLQMASSWGQAYTKEQWKGFRNWYEMNKERDLTDPFVPANVSGWSDKSWLKYYIVYLIESGKYCIYPRISLTTNFGEAGTHAKSANTEAQVPIQNPMIRSDYVISTLDESHAVYDSFFEPLGVIIDEKVSIGVYGSGSDNKAENAVIVDLYGVKPVQEMIAGYVSKKEGDNYRFVISEKRLPYKVLKGYGRQMRPIDANIVYEVDGNDYFLYDTKIVAPLPDKNHKALKFLYEYRGLSVARMIEIVKYRIMEKLGRI